VLDRAGALQQFVAICASPATTMSPVSQNVGECPVEPRDDRRPPGPWSCGAFVQWWSLAARKDVRIPASAAPSICDQSRLFGYRRE